MGPPQNKFTHHHPLSPVRPRTEDHGPLVCVYRHPLYSTRYTSTAKAQVHLSSNPVEWTWHSTSSDLAYLKCPPVQFRFNRGQTQCQLPPVWHQAPQLVSLSRVDSFASSGYRLQIHFLLIAISMSCARSNTSILLVSFLYLLDSKGHLWSLLAAEYLLPYYLLMSAIPPHFDWSTWLQYNWYSIDGAKHHKPKLTDWKHWGQSDQSTGYKGLFIFICYW